MTLSKRQLTEKDWDDFFHYDIAYRRSWPTDNDFEVIPTDQAQADLDTSKEIEAATGDSSEEEPKQMYQQSLPYLIAVLTINGPASPGYIPDPEKGTILTQTRPQAAEQELTS